MPRAARRSLILGAAAAAIVAGAALPAFAHHGWEWAEEAHSTLQGNIQTISMAPPHPVLTVRAANGAVWQVDLGNPNQTERSGFRGDTAKPGDVITVLGNRNRDRSKTHMKAVRVTIGGKNYDMYPERLPR